MKSARPSCTALAHVGADEERRVTEALLEARLRRTARGRASGGARSRCLRGACRSRPAPRRAAAGSAAPEPMRMRRPVGIARTAPSAVVILSAKRSRQSVCTVISSRVFAHERAVCHLIFVHSQKHLVFPVVEALHVAARGQDDRARLAHRAHRREHARLNPPTPRRRGSPRRGGRPRARGAGSRGSPSRPRALARRPGSSCPRPSRRASRSGTPPGSSPTGCAACRARSPGSSRGTGSRASRRRP